MTILFIGMPGSGKSFFSDLLSDLNSSQIISTDDMFRVLRGIPPLDDHSCMVKCIRSNFIKRPNEVELLIGNKIDDINNISDEEIHNFSKGRLIMDRFLEYAANNYQNAYIKLQDASFDIDQEIGVSRLNDSKFFREFGEDIFRQYEVEMNKWLNENGFFNKRIVSISASAPLYEENRGIFSKDNGYNIVLLNPDDDIIIDRLIADYHISVSESKIMRGAYEIAVNKAIKDCPEKAKETAIRDTISTLHFKYKADRMDKYISFADITIDIKQELKKEDVYSKLKEIINGL